MMGEKGKRRGMGEEWRMERMEGEEDGRKMGRRMEDWEGKGRGRKREIEGDFLID